MSLTTLKCGHCSPATRSHPSSIPLPAAGPHSHPPPLGPGPHSKPCSPYPPLCACTSVCLCEPARWPLPGPSSWACARVIPLDTIRYHSNAHPHTRVREPPPRPSPAPTPKQRARCEVDSGHDSWAVSTVAPGTVTASLPGVYPGAENVTSLMSQEPLNSAGSQGLAVPPSEAEKRLGLGGGRACLPPSWWAEGLGLSRGSPDIPPTPRGHSHRPLAQLSCPGLTAGR